MDDRPVIWDANNRKHVEVDHAERGVTCREIEEALWDPRRWEGDRRQRPGGVYVRVVGKTLSGRLIGIAYADHPGGRYPVHAHPAGRKEVQHMTKNGMWAPDPYEGWSDEEVEEDFARSMDASHDGVEVMIRVPKALVERIERLTDTKHLQPDNLMREALERGVVQLEREKTPK
jgi:hypothetical protein